MYMYIHHIRTMYTPYLLTYRTVERHLWWLYRLRDASRTLFLILFKHIHGSVHPRPRGDGLCAKESKRASEIAMRCRYIVYMSTLYDDISYCWLVAKSIVCVDSVVLFKTSYFFLKSSIIKSYCGVEFLC